MNFLSVCGLILGLLNAFLPMQEINKKIFKVKRDEPVQENFFQAQRYFTTVFFFSFISFNFYYNYYLYILHIEF